jgi:glycine/D-amino acid oxidase-like deaminating enzyme
MSALTETDGPVDTVAGDVDVVIIGGGFYGCSVGHALARAGESVLLLESRDALLLRASYVNQARIHHGYHYPRSLLTALRSSVNFPRFVADYGDCIDSSFDKYYAIARSLSNVTADQFVRFCERIGAPIAPAPREVRELFDDSMVEQVFRVTEFAFDAVRLRDQVARDLDATGVDVRLGCRAGRIAAASGGGMAVTFEGPDGTQSVHATRVFNCAYAGLNGVLVDSGLPPIPLKHEITELALVEPPPPFDRMGITVMCGPFFSIMPFPARGCHSLSHVRYTPHCEWHEGGANGLPGPASDRFELTRFRSRFEHMVRDASRFAPGLAGCRHIDSIWEVKTVLPRSEVDDSRPILLWEDYGLPGLTCVLGSKIDSVYDVLDHILAGVGTR